MAPKGLALIAGVGPGTVRSFKDLSHREDEVVLLLINTTR